MIDKIKLIITDVDGILTDGSIYIGKDGDEYKKFNVLDGAAVKYAQFAKIQIAVISGRYSDATTSRMKELGLNELCFQGALNKIKPYVQTICFINHFLRQTETLFVKKQHEY